MADLERSVEDFGDFNPGTASEHFRMGMAHLRRSGALFFGCANASYKPYTGASIDLPSQPIPLPKPAAAEPPRMSKASFVPDAAPDEDDLADVPQKCCAGEGCVILPTEPWKEMWDMWVLMLILYSAVMVPYRICFGAEATGYMYYFEQTVTYTFITDVTLNFNTAYLVEDDYITDRGKIAANYFRSWLWCAEVEAAL